MVLACYAFSGTPCTFADIVGLLSAAAGFAPVRTGNVLPSVPPERHRVAPLIIITMDHEMRTKEEAIAAGEALLKMLLQFAMTNGDAWTKLDPSKTPEMLAEDIEETVRYVHEVVRPSVGKKADLLTEKGRAVRNFDFEYERLWRIAISSYEHCLKTSTPDVEKFWSNPANASLLANFGNDARKQLDTAVVPLLQALPMAGDDFLLYTYGMVSLIDEKAAIERIASSGKTPAERYTAIYAMFGLLIQATRAKQHGDMGRAYSYLLDASHLVGMHENARYVMKLMPEVFKKRNAQLNSAKSRAHKEAAKVRAYELFTALRPTDTDGKPQPWKNAEDAAKRIWKELERESDPAIQYSTLQSLCRELHNVDKAGGVMGIRLQVVEMLPDGNERKIEIE